MFAAAAAATQQPDPIIAWQVILTLGVLLSSGASLLAIIRSGRAQKREIQQPLLVRPDERFASRDDFDKHVQQNREDFGTVREEMKQDRQENQVHASTRASALYKQIETTQDKLRSEIRVVSDKL